MKLLKFIFDWTVSALDRIERAIKNAIEKPIAGCIQEEPRKKLLSSVQVEQLPDYLFGLDGIIDLDNTHTYDQGRTPHCVCYATLLAIETMAIAKYQDRSITFDREYYAAKLREAGIMTDRGAAIYDVMDWFTANGVKDTVGRQYKVGEQELLPKSEIFNVLSKGYPIVTGAFWGYPYYDKNFIFLPRTLSTGGGHCTLLNKGYDIDKCIFPDGTRNIQRIVDTETSWSDRFGIKKKNSPLGTCRLHVLETDLPRFFTCHIFTSVERV